MKQRQIFDKYPHYFPTHNEGIYSSSPSKDVKNIFVNSQAPHQASHPYQENDLHDDMKPLIFLGRALFIIPCGRDDVDSYKDKTFEWRKIPVLISILIVLFMFIELILDFIMLVQTGKGGNLGVMQYISTAHFLFTTAVELSVNLRFLLNADKFYLIFKKWNETARKLGFVHDKYLKPLAYSLAAVAVIHPLSICSYVFAEKYSGHGDPELAEMSPFQIFWRNRFFPWKVFPYSPGFIIFTNMFDLWCLISMFFIFPMLIFFARAVSFQFRSLVEIATGPEHETAHYVDFSDKDKSFWEDLVQRHQAISLLMKAINHFLSPLIFIWTSMNIYLISIQLFRAWVGESGNMVSGLPSYLFIWSFAMETAIFLVTVIWATKVNTSSRRILTLLEKCPKKYYDDTGVRRLEQKIFSGPPTAFSGWGCFSITKRFLLNIFNAVFTFEIMLLQSNISKA